MKTILMTAYAVNPYKGSEEGTGWNWLCQAARNHRVVAVTRRNNRPDIERYRRENPDLAPSGEQLRFLYFDYPRWMIVWKKGPLLSALYFYLWQLGVALWLLGREERHSADLVHSLNFHSNWTPSFLWLLNKPFVWGPVGNHPLIPRQYVLPVYGRKAWWRDRLLWWVKSVFWNLDPWLWLSRRRASYVICVNSQAAHKLRVPEKKAVFMPAVAAERPDRQPATPHRPFTVLSVGRFVPLKGFDLTIRSFAAFYRKLTPAEQQEARLLLIGTGPCRARLEEWIREEGIDQVTTLAEWMPRAEVIRRFTSSSVFLFPSHEGAGMVVAEALSYGLPVVCLQNPGPGEYTPPASALRVPMGPYAGTVEALSERVYRLFRDVSFFHQESQLALHHWKDRFQWDSRGELLQKMYAALMERKIRVRNISPRTKSIHS